MSADDLPDPRELLVHAVRAGRPGAFEPWFEQEHGELWRLCFGLLADAAEADDLAQDAMLHLYDHLGDWDPSRPYRPWRDRLALNLCRDHLRRKAVRRRAEDSAAQAHGGEIALPERLPRPDEAASQDEVRAALRVALKALSPREREAFVLHDLEGHTAAEAAQVLGIGQSSVRSLLTLARRRLRGLLAARVPGLVPGEGGAA